MAASSTWQPVQFFSRSPGSRVFPSAVVHGELLYIFGGHDGSQYRNDLLVFNLETRTWILDLDVTGEGPSPRDAHAPAYFVPVGRERSTSMQAADEDLARRLWEFSLELAWGNVALM